MRDALGRYDVSRLERAARDAKEICPRTVFFGVHVLPEEGERLLEDQTVVVEDGAVVASGSSREVAVPDRSLVVMGLGKYLTHGPADHSIDFVLWKENPLEDAAGERGIAGVMVRGVFFSEMQLREMTEG